MKEISVQSILQEFQRKHLFTDEQMKNVVFGFTDDKSHFVVQMPIPTKQFMRTVLIDEMQAVVKVSPWLGAICMSSAIEFFGKCINENSPTVWDKSGTVREDFERSIRNLASLKDYRAYLKAESNGTFDLYDEMRCGLVHCFAPKGKLRFSHAQGGGTILRADGILNINVDEMVVHITRACEEIIAMKFESTNKVEQPRIYVTQEIQLVK